MKVLRGPYMSKETISVMQSFPTDFSFIIFLVIITFFLPGKTNTMVGRDEKEQTLGLIPCALSWLFKLISEQKQK